MHPFLTIADRAARVAGKKVIHALEKRDRIKVYQKSDSKTLVTDLDYSVERLLIDRIQESYPEHNILSEESGLIDQGSEYLWIIDPLDGTNNFVHGLSGLAISIAVKRRGVLEQALIYDPVLQEAFYASRGQGARLYHRRLTVSLQRSLSKSLFYIHSPSSVPEQPKQWANIVAHMTEQGVGIRMLGSVALGLAYVAAGRLDGFLSSSALKAWDVSAGALLIQEAGGSIQDLQGKDSQLDGPLVTANSRLCNELTALTKSLT